MILVLDCSPNSECDLGPCTHHDIAQLFDFHVSNNMLDSLSLSQLRSLHCGVAAVTKMMLAMVYKVFGSSGNHDSDDMMVFLRQERESVLLPFA